MLTEHLLQLTPTRFLVRRNVTPAAALAEIERSGDPRPGAIWLWSRGPLRCARDEANADRAAGQFIGTDTDTTRRHFVPDEFLVGDIADVPVVLSSAHGQAGGVDGTPRTDGDAHHGDDTGRTVTHAAFAPAAKFQRFLDMAKFSFYYAEGGEAKAMGTVYGALGKTGPARFALRVHPGIVRPSPAQEPFTTTRITLTVSGEEDAEGGRLSVSSPDGRFPRLVRRRRHGELVEATVWGRRTEARIEGHSAEVELRPMENQTTVTLTVQVVGWRGNVSVTIPVGEGEAAEADAGGGNAEPPGPPPNPYDQPDPAEEEPSLPEAVADADDGVEGAGPTDVETTRAWTMRMRWGLRSRPAHPRWFSEQRGDDYPHHYPEPLSHAWACSPLTGMFFAYWYNANFTVRSDFEARGSAGFGDYFTRSTLPDWVTSWKSVAGDWPEDSLERELAIDQTSRLPWTGARDIIPCIWLHKEDRWVTELAEVNFYKWHGKSHHMMLIKVASWEGKYAGVSRIRLYNPLNGKPLPAGAYQFSADGKWFQGNIAHSRLSFEYAAGLLGGPESIRYFTCGPTNWQRVLGPELGGGEDDSFEDLTPGRASARAENRETALTQRLSALEHARKAEKEGRTPRPPRRTTIVPPHNLLLYWWEEPTHAIHLYKGADIDNRGGTPSGPWATSGAAHAPLPLRMQYFANNYARGVEDDAAPVQAPASSSTPPAPTTRMRSRSEIWAETRDKHTRRYEGTWIRPTVLFPSRDELVRSHAEGGVTLPNAEVLDPHAQGARPGDPWYHWKQCERWITQNQPGGLGALWRYRSWPHPLHGEEGRSDTNWFETIRQHAAGHCGLDRCNEVWNAIANGLSPGGGRSGEARPPADGAALRTQLFRYLLRLANAALPGTLWSDFHAAWQPVVEIPADLDSIDALERRYAEHCASPDPETSTERRRRDSDGRAIFREWRQLTHHITGRWVPVSREDLQPAPDDLRNEVEGRRDTLRVRARDLWQFAGPSSENGWSFRTEEIRAMVDDGRDGRIDGEGDGPSAEIGIVESEESP
jgi:hypothetical protein